MLYTLDIFLIFYFGVFHVETDFTVYVIDCRLLLLDVTPKRLFPER